jgi:isopentenyl-diphosphate Delta-isomerase
MQELWQLYDKQGRPLSGKGASKDDTYTLGLLHGAAHVWIWRKIENNVSVLVQKRAADKRTWANLYDISAAGHIDLAEEPLTAALRETKEEIGLDVSEKDLQFIGIQYSYLIAENNAIEHEFQWLYLLEVKSEAFFTLQTSEVESLEWKTLGAFKKEVLREHQETYVTHGYTYFKTLLEAIEQSSRVS